MSEKSKKDASRLHPETFFLPPLKMILTFFDKESRQHEKEKKDAIESQEKATEKDVEKLIEKLSEKDERIENGSGHPSD